MNKFVAMAALAASAILPVSAHAIDSDINITMTVNEGLTVDTTGDLAYGGVFLGPDGGSLTLSPEGGLTETGAVTADPTGTTGVPTFSLHGIPNQAFAVTLPGSAVTLSGPSGGVTVDGFTENAPAALDASGDASFQVGATVNIPSGSTAGDYTGVFTVTVDYTGL